MADPTASRTPNRPFAPQMPRTAKPIERRGIPVQPMWVLSILIGISAAAVCLGCTALTGRCPLPNVAAEGISFVVLALTIFYLFRTCRGGARWIPIALLAVLLPVSYLSGTVIPAMTFAALLFCTGQSALLIAVCPKATMYRLPLLPLCAYAASLLLCRSPAAALICLVPFPAAAALAFGTRKGADSPEGPGRVGVICMTSLALGLTVLLTAVLALNVALEEGLTLAGLKAMLEEARTVSAAQLVEVSKQLAAAYGDTSVILTEEAALNDVNAVINMIPAFAVIACNITAALAQCVLHGSLSSFGYADSVAGRVSHFAMSTVSGITLLLAFIVSIIAGAASRESTLVGVAAENVMLILQPGLALCGYMRLMMTVFSRSRTGCLPVLLLLFTPLLITAASLLLALYEGAALVADIFLSRAARDGGKDSPDGPDDADGDDSDADDSTGGSGLF